MSRVDLIKNRHVTQIVKNKKENDMSQKNQKPAPTPETKSDGAKNESAKTETRETKVIETAPSGDLIAWSPLHEKAKDEKHIRFASQVSPEFYVHVWESHLEKFGPPSHGGKPMLRVAPKPSATSSSKAAREAEKAKLAAMTDEEKLEYAKQKRLARAAERQAKKDAERKALIEQLKKEIAEGKI